jgi:hypothetical protein
VASYVRFPVGTLVGCPDAFGLTIQHIRVMPVCLGRLLPTSRTLLFRNLQFEVLCLNCFRLQNAKISPAAGSRCFSKCGAAHWRHFGKEQDGTPSKNKKTESRSASKRQLPPPSENKKAKNRGPSKGQLLPPSEKRELENLSPSKKELPRPIPENEKAENWTPSKEPLPPPPRDDSAAWVEALDPFLLPQLRTTSNSGNESFLSAKQTCAAISDIFAEARTAIRGTDVLAELGVKHKRWPAVMWVIETLIADAARIESISSTQLPSNLDWSTFTPLEDMVCLPIRINQISYSNSVSSAQWDELHFDPRYTDQMWPEKNTPQ